MIASLGATNPMARFIPAEWEALRALRLRY
jgi:hypothetical protein